MTFNCISVMYFVKVLEVCAFIIIIVDILVIWYSISFNWGSPRRVSLAGYGVGACGLHGCVAEMVRVDLQRLRQCELLHEVRGSLGVL